MNAGDVSTRGVKGDHFGLGDGRRVLPLGDKQQNLALAFGEAELLDGFRAAFGGGLVLEAFGRKLLLETPHEFDPAIVPNPECAGNEQQNARMESVP